MEELIGQEFVQYCVRYTIEGYRKPQSMEYYWSNFHQRVWQHMGGIFGEDFKAMILKPKDKNDPKRCGKFENEHQ